MKSKITCTLLILFVVTSAGSLFHAEGRNDGTICLAALPHNIAVIDRLYPDRQSLTYKFTVQVDKLQPVKVPVGAESEILKGLDAGVKHLLVIRDDGRIIASFWFTFKGRGSSHLCLRFSPGYQTWELIPSAKDTRSCTCVGQAQ